MPLWPCTIHGIGLANQPWAKKGLERALSLNGIVSSALTSLQTNSAALRVVSGNVANINTPGYARRVVDQQTLVVGGDLAGVDIADIQRVVDQFVNQEQLSATGSSSRYSAQTSAYSQLNGMLGQPGDGTALTSQLDDVFGALGQAALAPSSTANQLSVVNSFQNLASTISSLSSSIGGLQSQVDRQVSSSMGTINNYLKQIFTLNSQIETATAAGDTSSGLLDQRDLAVQNLSQLVGVRTAEQPNGQMVVSTEDGTNLVGDSYAQLSYPGGASNGSYGPITITNVNPSTGQPIGTSQPFDAHLGSGSVKGLLDMRDGALSDLQQELGSFARQTALAFNKQSNANAAFPPPSSLTGRDTGLLSSDALNFTGKTTLAVADTNGNLVSRVDVDFGAGTLSVNGGASQSIGATIGSFTTALNSALGSNGDASFADGALSVSATGTNGIVVQDDATAPSNRGGTGFSQFFGLNDLFQAGAPSILSTGLSAGDAGGFAAGGTLSFVLKGPNGEVGKQANITLTSGMTVGNIVSALNTSFGGAATFALGADGSLAVTPSSDYSGYQLNVTADTTARGTTGMSFTSLFGLGLAQAANQAAGFSLNQAVSSEPGRLPFAQSTIDSSTAVGDTIVTHGDARGAIALQNIGSMQQSFARVGALGAQNATLDDYAASLYQDVATRSQTATANSTAQGDRLQEAQSRQSAQSGVNLDEELSNMMIYQQAYSAGARMLTVAQQLFDTLLQIGK